MATKATILAIIDFSISHDLPLECLSDFKVVITTWTHGEILYILGLHIIKLLLYKSVYQVGSERVQEDSSERLERIKLVLEFCNPHLSSCNLLQ